MRSTSDVPGSATTLPSPTIGEVDVERIIDEAEPFKVIIFNDDVNTFEHVIQALKEVFGHSEAVAHKITMAAHETGRAVAAVRPREEAERSVRALHQREIHATMEPA
jgi:ATP-dependent Clp protease adaptor protein ClpS